MTFKDEIASRIAKLKEHTSEPNWDLDRGLPIPAEEWADAESFLQEITAVTPYPTFVSPCGDGSIHFEWFVGENRIMVERKGGQMVCCVAYHGGERDGDWDEHEGVDNQHVIDVLNSLK